MSRLFQSVLAVGLSAVLATPLVAAGIPSQSVATKSKPQTTKPQHRFPPAWLAMARAYWARHGQHHHHHNHQNRDQGNAGSGGIDWSGGLSGGTPSFGWPETAGMSGFPTQDSMASQMLQFILMQKLLETQRSVSEVRKTEDSALRRHEADARPVERSKEKPTVKPAAFQTPVPHSSPRLSAEQFDRQTRQIHWPEALQTEETEDQRTRLEELIAVQPDSRDAARDRSRDARRLTSEMKDQLKKNIREVSPGEYSSARRFLDALANEFGRDAVKMELTAN